MSAVYTQGETRRNIMLSSAAVCGVWEVYYLVPHVSSLYSGETQRNIMCRVWEVGAAGDWPASVVLSAAQTFPIACR